MFNWLTFCVRYGVDYVKKGPNVAKNNINIQCPFCGADDHSHHLGLSLKKSYWGCWRNKTHRGRRPHRLIMLLIHCSHEEAEAIVGSGPAHDLGEFNQAMQNLKGNATPKANKNVLTMPNEFKPLSRDGHGKKFCGYLVRRGFKKADIKKLCDKYDLRYCLTGRWAYRIIFPIYMDRELVCWTSRTISNREKLRYLSLSSNLQKAVDRGEPLATMNIKDTILWYDNLQGLRGETFVLTEGPFDALKVDYYGRKNGVRATCLFSTDLRESQMVLLSSMVNRFRRKIILLDKGQLSLSMSLVNDLSHMGFELGKLPVGVDDPGELSPKQIELL